MGCDTLLRSRSSACDSISLFSMGTGRFLRASLSVSMTGRIEEFSSPPLIVSQRYSVFTVHKNNNVQGLSFRHSPAQKGDGSSNHECSPILCNGIVAVEIQISLIYKNSSHTHYFLCFNQLSIDRYDREF
jgi:hypothetical protein